MVAGLGTGQDRCKVGAWMRGCLLDLTSNTASTSLFLPALAARAWSMVLSGANEVTHRGVCVVSAAARVNTTTRRVSGAALHGR